ncbi:MAG TPA: hypothetical protein VGV68_13900 [Terriglobia bacterium]|nr:hypothetical protein [Terriglobia bacterium]
MGHGPFAKSSKSANTPTNRRRSTRFAFVAPIVISGRDSTNQPFREETETILVSFHGASLKTRNQILNGMHLTVENLLEGVAEQAICVSVAEPEPGEDQHVIAIQLLKPRNVWGVKNPPADWQTAAQISRQILASTPAPRPAVAAAPGGPAQRDPVATQPADFDLRSAELAESVLQLLRRQAAGILRESLKEFEDRLKVLELGAEARLIKHSEKAISDAEAQVSKKAEDAVGGAEVSLSKLRRDLLEQLAARTERAVASAEENLREKIAELSSPLDDISPDVHPEKKIFPDTHK